MCPRGTRNSRSLQNYSQQPRYRPRHKPPAQGTGEETRAAHARDCEPAVSESFFSHNTDGNGRHCLLHVKHRNTNSKRSHLYMEAKNVFPETQKSVPCTWDGGRWGGDGQQVQWCRYHTAQRPHVPLQHAVKSTTPLDHNTGTNRTGLQLLLGLFNSRKTLSYSHQNDFCVLRGRVLLWYVAKEPPRQSQARTSRPA